MVRATILVSLLAVSALAAEPFKVSLARTANQAEAANAVRLLEPYLSTALGRPVKVNIAADYDELSAELASGRADIAWIPPLPFVKAWTRNRKVKALAKINRGGILFYRSVLFTRGGDKAPKALSDLKGKKVAWVDRSSTSGYTFPLGLVMREGNDPKTFFAEQKFLGEHSAVCKAVLEGAADVGATFANEPVAGAPLKIDGCRGAAPDDKLATLSVVAKTEPISNDVVAARGDLPAADAKAAQDVLLKLHETAQGRQVLREVFQADGFEAAADADFEHVRQAQQLLSGK